MALPKWFRHTENGILTQCEGPDCGATHLADLPTIPPGWRETPEGPMCPRHELVVFIADRSPEDVMVEALVMDVERDQERKARRNRDEREKEQRRVGQERQQRRAARRAREVEAKRAEAELRQQLVDANERTVWADKRAVVVLNQVGWDSDQAARAEWIAGRWPHLEDALRDRIEAACVERIAKNGAAA